MNPGSEDRNLAMIAHGLVLLTGVCSFLGGLRYLGWLAAVVSVVLYFMWKTKSPFVVRHAKQAAGLQVFLFLFTFGLFIVASAMTVGAAAAGSIGGAFAILGLTGLISFAVGVAAIVCAVLGLMNAQKGEEYTYPVVGGFVDRINV